MRPAAHHRNTFGHVFHHRKIVRDEQIGEPDFRLQILQQIENLRLDRDVERRNRLVEDEQVGVQRQRARDADALALPARETVRVAVQEAQSRPSSTACQQFLGPLHLPDAASP